MATKAAKEAGKRPAGKMPTSAAPEPAAEGTPATGEGKMSALAAAAKVLAEAAGVSMTCRQLVAVMAVKGYWRSPGGKTPQATLHAAISTEIRNKGDAARFRKTAPGRFAAAGAPGTRWPTAAGRKAAGRASGRERAGTGASG